MRPITIDELCHRYNRSKRWVYERSNLPRLRFNGKTTRPLMFDLDVIEKLFVSNDQRSLTIKEFGETTGISLPPKEELCL